MYNNYCEIHYVLFCIDFSSDEEKAADAARHLKNEFLKLLTVAYHVVSAADVGLFKLCVNWFLNSARPTTPEIEKYVEQVETIPTSLGILGFLVRNNFIGYLNYMLLKEFLTMLEKSEELNQHIERVGSKELKTDIEVYDRKHHEFIHSFSFNTIMKVFKQCPNLAPSSHIGLPNFKIHLLSPWNDKSVYEWTEFFKLRFSWPPFLVVTEVSQNSIIFTYAVLPIFVTFVVRDLTNPSILKELEESGVKVQLSNELLEINDRISKPATNTLKNIEMHTPFSKQLSFSDGSVHTLGIRESSLMVNYIHTHVSQKYYFVNLYRTRKERYLHKFKYYATIKIVT